MQESAGWKRELDLRTVWGRTGCTVVRSADVGGMAGSFPAGLLCGGRGAPVCLHAWAKSATCSREEASNRTRFASEGQGQRCVAAQGQIFSDFGAHGQRKRDLWLRCRGIRGSEEVRKLKSLCDCYEAAEIVLCHSDLGAELYL